MKESIILLIAIIIPGGMLIYLGWKLYKKLNIARHDISI